MSVNQFNLPDVGEGLTEAEIVTWMVKPGDTIKVNDVVCEIETAKSLVELPSPYAGTVTELLVPEGQTVPVGTPIIAVSSGEAAPTAATGEPAQPAAAPAGEPGAQGGEADPYMHLVSGEGAAAGADGGEAPTPTLVGYGPRTAAAKRRPRKPATPPSRAGAAAQQQLQASFTPEASPPAPEPAEPAEPAVPATSAEQPESATVQVLAKPPVRKLARDLGVDLGQVTASGPNGTITRADVEAHASGTAQVSAAEAAPVRRFDGERETRVPIKGVRKMTAQAMVASAFTAPHVTEWVTVDATGTMDLVERLRGHRDFREVKVSPLLVVARAVCLAMRRTPEVNAFWDDASQEIVLKSYVNLGIAAATPRGLVVPNVKDADSMSAVDLAAAINRLAETARAGKTQPSEMSGGTFTITNVGVFGVDSGTPIINPGESAILCMGAIRKQPWVVDDEIKARWVTTLALSFDHRLVDGEHGSRFLADVASVVEDPGTALLF